MFQSGWLSMAGLSVEIVGLAFLFWDLLGSKGAGRSELEFRKIQDETDAASQELIGRLNRGLITVAEFVASYLSVLEMEAEHAVDRAKFAKKAEDDPAYATMMGLFESGSPTGLRRHAVGRFAKASQALPTREDIDRALSLIASGRQSLDNRYQEELARSARLLVLVRIGILFVAVGASCQLLDLVV